jgi:uncharacterized membrane protein
MSRLIRIKRWAYVGLVVVALAEILLPRIFGGGESHFSFEDFPAWGSLYGFVSCVAIIVVSKLLGKLWLMVREDYYDS